MTAFISTYLPGLHCDCVPSAPDLRPLDSSASTAVCQSKELEIDPANPLAEPAILTATCDSNDIVVKPSCELVPNGETPCSMFFRPLLETLEAVEPATLTFSSPELGDFVSSLCLLKAPIGTEAIQTFHLCHRHLKSRRW